MTKAWITGTVSLLALLAIVFTGQSAQAATAPRASAVADDTSISWTVKGSMKNVVGFRVSPKGEYPFIVPAESGKRSYSLRVPFDASGARISVVREICKKPSRCKVHVGRAAQVRVAEAQAATPTPDVVEEQPELSLTMREDGRITAVARTSNTDTYAAIQALVAGEWHTMFTVPTNSASPVVVAQIHGVDAMRIVELDTADNVVATGTVLTF